MHSPRSICLFLSPLICLLMLSIWKSEVKKEFLLRHKEFRNFALFGYLQGQEWCQHSGVRVYVCVCVCMYLCVCVSVHAQSCPTLWDLIDHSLPGSCVHGIFHARILKWVAISYSRGSSQPKDQTHVSYVSCIGRQVLYHQCHLGSPDANTALLQT